MCKEPEHLDAGEAPNISAHGVGVAPVRLTRPSGHVSRRRTSPRQTRSRIAQMGSSAASISSRGVPAISISCSMRSQRGMFSCLCLSIDGSQYRC
jgi:hypothetical protein